MTQFTVCAPEDQVDSRSPRVRGAAEGTTAQASSSTSRAIRPQARSVEAATDSLSCSRRGWNSTSMTTAPTSQPPCASCSSGSDRTGGWAVGPTDPERWSTCAAKRAGTVVVRGTGFGQCGRSPGCHANVGQAPAGPRGNSIPPRQSALHTATQRATSNTISAAPATCAHRTRR